MNLEIPVKALAVLSAIPVVALAIWIDHFGRAIAKLAAANPGFDRKAELVKVRIAGVIALFAQLLIWTATSDIRLPAPWVAWGILASAALAQAWLQARLEKKLRQPAPSSGRGPSMAAGIDPNPLGDFETTARGFVWAVLGGALYIACFLAPVLATGAALRSVQLSPGASMLILLTAAAVGLLGGLGLNFALAPVYLRRLLPVSRLGDGELGSLVQSCFAQAGLVVPAIWVVENGHSREATAMMAGFASGRGLFRPGLFLTRALMDKLTPGELRAVVLHEIAHLKLRHLRKKLLRSVATIIGTTFLATFAIFVAVALLPASEVKNYIGFVAAAATFVITFKLLARQRRAQETEADAYSVEVLGADSGDLVSALRKLDPAGSPRPETDRRVSGLMCRSAKINKQAA